MMHYAYGVNKLPNKLKPFFKKVGTVGKLKSCQALTLYVYLVFL